MQTEGPLPQEYFSDPRKSCSGHTQVTCNFKEESLGPGMQEKPKNRSSGWLARVILLDGRSHKGPSGPGLYLSAEIFWLLFTEGVTG